MDRADVYQGLLAAVLVNIGGRITIPFETKIEGAIKRTLNPDQSVTLEFISESGTSQ